MVKYRAIGIFAGLLLGIVLSESRAESPSRGLASYYGYHSDETASGELMNPDAMTAAHRSWPFGSRVRVTVLSTQRAVIVRINDRGPFVNGRIIDVSNAAAKALGIVGAGVAMVEIEVIP